MHEVFGEPEGVFGFEHVFQPIDDDATTRLAPDPFSIGEPELDGRDLGQFQRHQRRFHRADIGWQQGHAAAILAHFDHGTCGIGDESETHQLAQL